jgi:hypothetical protein
MKSINNLAAQKNNKINYFLLGFESPLCFPVFVKKNFLE